MQYRSHGFRVLGRQLPSCLPVTCTWRQAGRQTPAEEGRWQNGQGLWRSGCAAASAGDDDGDAEAVASCTLSYPMAPTLKPSLLDRWFNSPQKVQNQSQRWTFLCSLCKVAVEHRGSRLLEHLAGTSKQYACASTTQEVRVLVLPHLGARRGATDENSITAEVQSASSLDDTTADVPAKKRKLIEAGLGSFVVPCLTKKETQKADLLLLRYESQFTYALQRG
jgi:hypothetical protein